jgi:hypothetical protein
METLYEAVAWTYPDRRSCGDHLDRSMLVQQLHRRQ